MTKTAAVTLNILGALAIVAGAANAQTDLGITGPVYWHLGGPAVSAMGQNFASAPGLTRCSGTGGSPVQLSSAYQTDAFGDVNFGPGRIFGAGAWAGLYQYGLAATEFIGCSPLYNSGTVRGQPNPKLDHTWILTVYGFAPWPNTYSGGTRFDVFVSPFGGPDQELKLGTVDWFDLCGAESACAVSYQYPSSAQQFQVSFRGSGVRRGILAPIIVLSGFSAVETR